MELLLDAGADILIKTEKQEMLKILHDSAPPALLEKLLKRIPEDSKDNDSLFHLIYQRMSKFDIIYNFINRSFMSTCSEFTVNLKGVVHTCRKRDLEKHRMTDFVVKDKICAICKEEQEPDFETRCGHFFHESC